MRIVYGRSELQPEEISWLKELTYITPAFAKISYQVLHNEEILHCLYLNLYEFSQVNPTTDKVLIRRADDGELYCDAYDEAQRIIRVSEEVRITLGARRKRQ